MIRTKLTIGNTVFNIINYAVFTIFTLICIYPFYYLIINTISANDLSANGVINFLPQEIHLKNYIEVLKLKGLGQAAVISLLRTSIGTACTVMASAFLGFMFTQQKMWKRKLWYRMLVITMYFNAGLIPVFITMHLLGLTNNFWVYIIPAIENRKPEGILILGTSDGMVEKIAHALHLGEITERVYIHQVASEFEIEQARTTRMKQGKHVIPVPATELKKQFSGFFLDPLQLFRRQGKGSFQHIGEKSVVRPTFSYFGKYTISDMAIYQVVAHLLLAMPGMDKITRFRTSNTPEGLILDMDVIMVYGYNIVETTREAQQSIIEQLDRFAGLQVMHIQIQVKTLSMSKTVMA